MMERTYSAWSSAIDQSCPRTPWSGPEVASAQDLASLNAKILRLKPDGTVPSDNPFPGSLVYTYGHRNVQGITWDPQGRLWSAEFGQNSFDEVNLIVAGSNYGWPANEGTDDTEGGRFTNPVVTWTTAEASPSGIAYWRGALYVAALRGRRPPLAAGSHPARGLEH